jgi:YD repeat-containing protein
MKKTLFLLSLTVAILASCKSDTTGLPQPTPATPTTLLTKIINNTIGDAGFGKSHLEFSYNGKQLIKAVRYEYKTDGSVNNAETTTFNYNSSGNLTGTTVTNSNSAVFVTNVSSTITAIGNNISEIKLYQANNVLADDIVITYKNGIVNETNSPLSEKVVYTYNNAGNNTQGYITTNNLFDSKNNLSKAWPFWLYFCYVQFPDGFLQGVPLYDGTNNVVGFTYSGSNYSYSYQYNSYDYPSISTSTAKAGNGAAMSYQYQYIQVN